MNALSYDFRSARYQALIGVGGIGTGVFFLLKGNHTLGREESRSGRFLDRRDYCKLHIIAHYVKTLLGPAFTAIPIGMVGKDEPGTRLLREMAETGFDLRFVKAVPDAHTLFSTCFLYPDGSGGNLTTDDSANSKVGVTEVRGAQAEFARFVGRGIALAVPEVSLEARRELLRLGTDFGFFRAASLTTAEIADHLVEDILGQTDFLAINLEEAASLGGMTAPEVDARAVVEAAIARLRSLQPEIWVSITGGKLGNWAWDGSAISHLPAIPVEVTSTAGAGDAHFGGMLAGIAAGLPFRQAQTLGTLVAALSVTSPHTIHPGIDRHSLQAFADREGVPLSPEVAGLLK